MKASLRRILGSGLIGFIIWLISLILLAQAGANPSHPQEGQVLGILCWFSCPLFIIFPAIFVWALRKNDALPEADTSFESEKAKNSEPKNPDRHRLNLFTAFIYSFILVVIVLVLSAVRW